MSYGGQSPIASEALKDILKKDFMIGFFYVCVGIYICVYLTSKLFHFSKEKKEAT